MVQTTRQFMAGAIKAHEGGLSVNPADNGNWFDPARYKQGLPQKRNLGKLVGSKYGVTAYALANYRNDPVIEAWEMAQLTFDEAVDIAEQLYVRAPRFNLLQLNRVTLILIDFGWMSGASRAIKELQRLIGAGDDGKIGTETINKYAAWIKLLGEEKAARALIEARIKFTNYLASNEGPQDPDRIYRKGWQNRAESFLPSTSWWRAAA